MRHFARCGWLAAALSLGLNSCAFAAVPAIASGGVVNAADYTSSISPGVIMAVFGTNLAPDLEQSGGPPLPATLNGVSVEVVDGTHVLQAPLFFISTGQINAQFPFEVTSSTVAVRVRNAQGVSNSQTVTVTPRAPCLFTKSQDGKGEPLVLHANFTLVSNSAPAKPGETLVLYLSGLGAVSPAVASGKAAGDGSAAAPLNLVTDDVTVMVDGTPAKVDYKGLAPYWVGLYQVNFDVPSDTVPGNVELTIQAGGHSSADGVAFAMTMAMDSPVSASITPAGGTISAGAVTINAPAGAVAQTAALTIYRSGSDYVIAGLGSGTAAPITVTVDLPSGTNITGDAYLALRRVNGPEEYAKATVSGTQISATFPAIPSVVGSQSSTPHFATARPDQPRDDANDLAEKLILAIILGDTHWAPGTGRFDLIYNPNTAYPSQVLLDDFLNGLNNAFDALAGAFPSWKPALPITVRVETLEKRSSWYCNGEIVANFNSSGYFIRARPAVFTNDWKPTSAADGPLYTAYHLLFHYLAESMYGTGMSVTQDTQTSHMWLDEAAATGWIAYQSYGRLPEVVSKSINPDAVWLGLAPDGSWTPLQARKQGFASAPFFRALLDAPGLPTVAKAFDAMWRNNTPWWTAMSAAGIDIGEKWAEFVRDRKLLVFGLSDTWASAGPFSTIGVNMGTLASPPGAALTAYADGPELSAQLFWFALPETLPPGYDLFVSLTPATNLVALVYSVGDTGSPVPSLTLLGEGQSLTFTNLAGQMGIHRSVAIIVYNNQGDQDPDTYTEGHTLTVGFRPTYLGLLHQDNYIEFDISGKFACNTTLPLCPSSISAFNLFVVDPKAKPVPFAPTSWSNAFSTFNDQTSGGYGQSYQMDVRVSDSGDEIVDAKVTYTTVGPIGTTGNEQIHDTFEITHVKITSANAQQQVFQVTGAAAAQALQSLTWSDTLTGKLQGSASSVTFGATDGIRIVLKNVQ